jgi:hypothetical protein
MNKSILFAFLLFAMVNLATAQVDLIFEPETVEKTGIADPDDLFLRIEAYGRLVNNGTESITFRWERKIVDAPENWIFQTCDTNQCYEAPVYSNIQPGLNIPVTVGPGQSTPISVYATPKGEAGTASVIMEIADVNNTDVVLASGSFEFTATAVSDTEAPVVASKNITIFPNPSTSYFEVRGNEKFDRVVVYNIVGREVRSFNAAPNKRYNVNDLANGLYLVSFISNNKGVVRTLRLSKQSSRP